PGNPAPPHAPPPNPRAAAGKPPSAAGPTAAKPGATPESAKSVTPVATASVVAESVRPAPKPAPTPGGNGESLAKDALLKLTPSQRVHAREAGVMPSRAPAAPAAPSDDARLAQVDPRDEIVAMSPLRKRVAE